MSVIYKVLTEEEWDDANLSGYIETELDKEDGFVHLSTSKQLALTLHMYFKNSKKVVLLEINQDFLNGKLAFEELKLGNRKGKFPHLYGKLLIKNIKKNWLLSRNGFELPEKVLEESEKI